MAFSPQLLSVFAPRTHRIALQTFEKWLEETEYEIDRSIAYTTGLVAIKGEHTASHCWTRPSLGRALTEGEIARVQSMYLRAGWGEVRVHNKLLCDEIHMVIIQLYPPTVEQDDGLESLVSEMRKFAAGRQIKILTRKANSQANSDVARSATVHELVEEGCFEIYLRVNAKDGVGAANVRTTAKLLKPRPRVSEAGAWPDFECSRMG